MNLYAGKQIILGKKNPQIPTTRIYYHQKIRLKDKNRE